MPIVYHYGYVLRPIMAMLQQVLTKSPDVLMDVIQRLHNAMLRIQHLRCRPPIFDANEQGLVASVIGIGGYNRLGAARLSLRFTSEIQEVHRGEELTQLDPGESS